MLVRFSFGSYSSFDFVLVFVLLIVVLERSHNQSFNFHFIPYCCCFFGVLLVVEDIPWNHGSGPTILGSLTSFVKFCVLCCDWKVCECYVCFALLL